jgi:hypothetical protein
MIEGYKNKIRSGNTNKRWRILNIIILFLIFTFIIFDSVILKNLIVKKIYTIV